MKTISLIMNRYFVEVLLSSYLPLSQTFKLCVSDINLVIIFSIIKIVVVFVMDLF